MVEAIRVAARLEEGAIAARAVKAASKFDRATTVNAHGDLIDGLLCNPNLAGQR
ncbi:hypothetical protein QA641_17035 [Bradyrhizobium sp. CB1650]|uniref:hypothetical protein n=1 Tax=Bradyrhizobium sp. CB1650 TaxID=3039153 RepID=UPI002436068B|nr:hypothetical protein [Bradyrhizobium sp. CB1650]WGD55428.1 hypothetical protein QA641_17035 [Bradyrhizobium sp. CB1650]